jgi:hypothetical protein
MIVHANFRGVNIVREFERIVVGGVEMRDRGLSEVHVKIFQIGRPILSETILVSTTDRITHACFCDVDEISRVDEIQSIKWELRNGAGEGNRTLVFSLEGCCSTIELHPRRRRYATDRRNWQRQKVA